MQLLRWCSAVCAGLITSCIDMDASVLRHVDDSSISARGTYCESRVFTRSYLPAGSQRKTIGVRVLQRTIGCDNSQKDASERVMKPQSGDRDSIHVRIGSPMMSSILSLMHTKSLRFGRPHYVEEASDPQFAWQADGKIHYWSRAAQRLYGHSARQAVGRRVQTLLKVDWPQSFDHILADLRRDGSWNGEVQHRARDGRLLVVESLIKRVVDDAAEMFVESTRSVTDTSASRVRLDDIMLDIDDQFVSYDRLWRIVFINDAAAHHFGRRVDELVGKCAWDVMPELVGTQYYEDLNRAATEQRELRVNHFSSRSSRWLQHSIYPSKSGVSVLTIETQRKSAQSERDQEDASNQDIMAILAHEIKGSLAPIRNGVEFLQRIETNAPGVTRTVNMLSRQTRQMLFLVNDLLDSHRKTLAELQLNRTPLSLRDLVREALEDSRQDIDKKGLALVHVLDKDPLMCDVDAGRIEQVMRNLLTNACKYTDRGGTVTVRTYRTGMQAIIDVQDTGIGIPQEFLSSIFEMFARVPQAHRAAEGLGIGLALVRVLVELHGGTVTAFSEGSGRGSRFCIHLPLLANKSNSPLASC
jgi:PAS domain S-box-containing protein